MALQNFLDLAGGFAFPVPFDIAAAFGFGATNAPSTLGTIDAAGEIYAYIGPAMFSDSGAGGSATINTSSSIEFRAGAVTWANSATSIDIGIQDIDGTNTTAPTRPDGTYDAKATITPAGGANPVTITGSAYNSVTMTTGSKTISHGDLIAVVFEMTARGGTDSLTVAGHSTGNPISFGGGRTYLASSWAVANGVPMLIIKPGGADTRYIGVPFGMPYDTSNVAAFNDASANDEMGNIFQVPFKCKTRAVAIHGFLDSLSSDFDVTIYSDPTGTPAAMATATTFDSGQWRGHTAQRPGMLMLSSEITLSPATNYCIAVKSAGANTSHDFNLSYVDVADSNHFKLYPCGTNAYGVQRNNGSGAFSSINSGTRLFILSCVISALDDGTTARVIGG